MYAVTVFEITLVSTGTSVPLGEEPLHVGRGPSNHVVLADDTVSWNHAQLWVEAGRAWVRKRRGEAVGAIADYGEALARNPDDEASLYGRGFLRAAAGDAAGALTDLRRLLELRPAHPAASHVRETIARLESSSQPR